MLCRYPYLVISVVFALSACTSNYSEQPIKPIRSTERLNDIWDNHYRFFIGQPTPTHFSVCHSMSCYKISEVSLDKQDWQEVLALFSKTDSAEEERHSIQQAIARLEILVGKQIGSQHDLARNQIASNRYGQMDCVDEATNTSVYLRMLENADVLRWHTTAFRTSRGIFQGQAPHNTATIIDTQTQTRYAVDSWFYANGKAPIIIQLDKWMSGWEPESN